MLRVVLAASGLTVWCDLLLRMSLANFWSACSCCGLSKSLCWVMIVCAFRCACSNLMCIDRNLSALMPILRIHLSALRVCLSAVQLIWNCLCERLSLGFFMQLFMQYQRIRANNPRFIR